jgi:uncharacterized repeat protein (TIGR03803 family)
MTIVAASVLGWSALASAQIDVVHSFPGPGAVNPQAPLLLATDGNFYGSTSAGGAAGLGTIFKMTPAGTVTVLHSFTSGSDGASPYSALIQATDGNFYGTTVNGGDQGTVFKMTSTGILTILHSFDLSGGASPYGALVQATDGNFYGTALHGGAASRGVAFRITPDGVFTVLHSFLGIFEGANPQAGLIQATDGNFYGTTYYGGDLDRGTIFQMTPAGVVTTLHSFVGFSIDGLHPDSPLIQATDGSLYGTTPNGGKDSAGIAFKMTLGGTYTLLHAFNILVDGGSPSALLQAPDGNFYGTATNGGANFYGTVYQMTPAGTITPLHAFTGTDGAYPYAAVVRAADGSLYGTTQSGGAFNAGAVFQVTTAGTYTLLNSFTGGPEPAFPKSALIRSNDGVFYGTSYGGGTADLGTVFKATSGGVVTLLHSFANTGDGSRPITAVVQANDGNLYGTEGTGNLVFKLTLGGTFTVTHSLSSGTEGYIPSSLIQANDGILYGTAQYGGASSHGTAFKLTLAGAFTLLHTFAGGASDGASPTAPLVQATDGNFYGTTSGGGPSNFGTVLRMTPAGAITLLHAFAGGTDGRAPNAPLIQAPDGLLYGTTTNGGSPSDYGAVFRTDLAGTSFTILHAFDNTNGALPYAGLVRAPDGNFYGTTSSGGPSGAGTIFSMTPAGAFTLLYSFNNSNGSNPFSGLVRSPGGNFYGTAYSLGPTLGGDIFHFSVAPPTFTDDPLIAGSTMIRAVHVTELRSRIDAARFAAGLATFAYTDPTLTAGTTIIKVQHILDLRTALAAVYTAAGMAPPTYTDPSLAAGMTTKVAHIAEIRAALLAIE